jgi:FO synthase
VRQTPESLREVAAAAGRPVAERTTTYDRREAAGIRYRVLA